MAPQCRTSTACSRLPPTPKPDVTMYKKGMETKMREGGVAHRLLLGIEVDHDGSDIATFRRSSARHSPLSSGQKVNAYLTRDPAIITTSPTVARHRPIVRNPRGIVFSFFLFRHRSSLSLCLCLSLRLTARGLIFVSGRDHVYIYPRLPI